MVVALERLRRLLDDVGQRRQHRPVERLGDLAGAGAIRVLGGQPEHELRRVEDLDGQPPPDLELPGVEGGVDAVATVGRPVAHGVGAVLLQQVDRGDHVALGLGHLLAVGVEDPPRDGHVAPRQRAELVVGPDHGREQPGADDLVGLRPQVGREDPPEQVVVAAPAAGDLGGQRRGGPGVHDVGVGHEAAGHAALLLGVAGGHVGGRLDGQHVLGGQDRRVVDGLPGLVDRIPHRERHAEEALAGDEPVAGEPFDPVVVADPHVRRMPGQLAPALQQPPAQLLVPPAVADVPLAGGDDLKRLVALFVKFHRALHRPGLTFEVTGLAQQLHDALAGAVDGLAGQLLVRLRLHAVGRLGQQPPVPADDRPGRQVQLTPPGDVGDVAERADHRDAGALVGLGQAVGQHRHLDPEQRRQHRGAEQLLVALVVGMGDQRHAGGDELGPGGLDEDRALLTVEGDLVEGAGPLAVLQLGLGHGGAEADVPEGRRLGEVGLAAQQVAQERALGDRPRLVADRGVEQRPVDRQPDPPPDLLEGLLVDGGQLLAQLDEVAPRDGDVSLAGFLRRGEAGVVGQRGIAAHAVDVLHAALGGQAVVVPADGVEDGFADHPLVAGHNVGVGEGEDVTDVQRTGDRRRRRVDGVDLLARPGPVEAVGALFFPASYPYLLQAVESRLLGHGGTA